MMHVGGVIFCKMIKIGINSLISEVYIKEWIEQWSSRTAGTNQNHKRYSGHNCDKEDFICATVGLV